MLPNSWTIDHVGIHTRSVADAALLWPCMREKEPRPFARMPEPPLRSRPRIPGSPPRLGYIREFFEAETSPEVLENLAAVREQLLRAGAEIVELAFPPSFAFVGPCWSIIKQAELYAYHRHLFEAHRDDYPPKLKVRLEKGASISGHEYVEHLRYRILFQREMSEQDGRRGCGDHADRRDDGAPGALLDRFEHLQPALECLRVSGHVASRRVSTQTDSPLRCRWRHSPTSKRRLLDVAAWCEKVLAFTRVPAEVAKTNTL